MTATAAAVAACSPQKPGAVAQDGSVTVTHMFGETKVPAAPKRVVSAGYTEQDDLLAGTRMFRDHHRRAVLSAYNQRLSE